MMEKRYGNPHRAERYEARAKRARFWAWPVQIALVGCVGAAIWQEPALSPEGHAMLKTVADRIDGPDGAQSYLASLSAPSQDAPDN
ncbi:MAG: hypothetical protein RQ750_07025 [Roseovarius sp.]|nr:hypothetical protein [Roseovarius sp.]